MMTSVAMSASYYLWMKQCGEGCDYTIGCGEKLVELKGAHEGNLATKVKSVIEDYGSDLEQAKVLVFLNSADDILAAEKERQAIQRKLKKIEKKEQEVRRMQAEIAELKTNLEDDLGQ